jgi:glycosidase
MDSTNHHSSIITHQSFRAWLIVLVLLFATSAPASAQVGHETWSHNLGVYEINIRNFTQAGTFAAAELHLDRLDELGVGIIWLMPIYPIGEENRLGSLGSPYSIRNYLEVNPQYGALEDLESFVDAAHERGMYVLLDWVANHTSWDNVLTEEHPEWYVTDSNGDFIPPPNTNWSDVIELDFSEAGLRDYMIDGLRYWVEEAGVDGFRFDAVDFVPMDFWEEATAALKATRSDLFLLAEGPHANYHDAGFDATHAWSFYGFGSGVAKRIADGVNDASALGTFVQQEEQSYPDDAYRLLFTSNHDENAWHGTPSELFGAGAHVLAVLTATLDGLPLIYMGQEAGLNRRLAFFERDPIVWSAHENADFYRTLLELKRRNSALWSGAAGGDVEPISTNADEDVFAFRREADDDRVVVFSNLSAEDQHVTFDASSFVGEYRDVFNDGAVELAGTEEFVLGAWSFLVLEKTAAGTSSEDPKGADVFLLEGSHPNPASTATSLGYVLPSATEVRITLFDVLGRKVETLVSERQAAGTHRLDVDVSRLATGTYFMHVDARGWTEMTRVAVVR